jgi:hypothetical protein
MSNVRSCHGRRSDLLSLMWRELRSPHLLTRTLEFALSQRVRCMRRARPVKRSAAATVERSRGFCIAQGAGRFVAAYRNRLVCRKLCNCDRARSDDASRTHVDWAWAGVTLVGVRVCRLTVTECMKRGRRNPVTSFVVLAPKANSACFSHALFLFWISPAPLSFSYLALWKASRRAAGMLSR